MNNCVSRYEKEGVLVPSAVKKFFKDHSISRVLITEGLNGCLFMFSEQDWEQQKVKFKSISFTKKQANKMQKLFFPPRPLYPVDCNNARITINDKLRKFAGIKNDIVFVCRNNKVEIWDRERYDEHRASQYS